MPKPTMQDIADALSTSRITVWKALNNRPGVSEALRRQILQKAQELGYGKAAAPAGRAETPPACRPHGAGALVSPPGKLADLDADRAPAGAGADRRGPACPKRCAARSCKKRRSWATARPPPFRPILSGYIYHIDHPMRLPLDETY